MEIYCRSQFNLLEVRSTAALTVEQIRPVQPEIKSDTSADFGDPNSAGGQEEWRARVAIAAKTFAPGSEQG
jgi:hypothetical protein